MDQIQDEYQGKVDEYQVRVDQYQLDVADYQEALADWQLARNEAVAKAEAMIKEPYTNFTWTFADKSNTGAYWFKIVKSWFAQAVIISILFMLTMVFMKRKDGVK